MAGSYQSLQKAASHSTSVLEDVGNLAENQELRCHDWRLCCQFIDSDNSKNCC